MAGGALTARPRLGGPLPWLGALLVAYLAVPVAAFADRFARTPDRGFGAPGLWGALGVSVEGATVSLVVVTVLGVPLAYVLAHRRGPLASAVGVLVQLPLALPPLMSGILLLFVAGPYTPLGRLFGGRLTETLAGVVIAQSFVSAPFLVIAARSAFTTVDPALADMAATLGHRPLARFLRVDLRSAAAGIRAGMVLTWLRAFGEYGATVIVAYHPFSLPIYTDNQFQTYPLSTTEAPTLLALAVAASVVLLGQLRRPAARVPASRPAAAPPTVGAPAAVGFQISAAAGSFRLSVAHPAGAARLAIVGPSGAGKSLTLRGLAGLLGPAAGGVQVGGREVGAWPPEDRRIGYVPQGLALMGGLTVWQQLVFGRHTEPARAAWWAERLELADLLHRYPDQLSGGQRQRVSLARALSGDPQVLLLDEPFSALDAPVRRELRGELRRLQRETGLSTVLVTHDPEEAAALADEVLVVSAGAVLQSGPVGQLYARPASTEVARLLGIPNVLAGTVTGPGAVRAGDVALSVSGPLPPAGTVLWRVAPEQVRLAGREGAAGTGWYPAVVVDVVELGVAREVLVRLRGGPCLLARRGDAVSLLAGQDCGVRLDPDQIRVWPVAGQRGQPPMADMGRRG